jgi:hypothetical protein
VSVRLPPVHHHHDGRGVEHGQATMNDVGDTQQVCLPKKELVLLVEKNHHQPIVGPDTEGQKNSGSTEGRSTSRAKRVAVS